MSPRRAASGGRIDRSRPIRFTFDGTSYTGHAGDTLASALLANGVTLMGRSFKYHRPRGVMTAGVDEPNALVTIVKGDIREPNIPATTIEIFDGLEVVSQRPWPRRTRLPPASGRSWTMPRSSTPSCAMRRPSRSKPPVRRKRTRVGPEGAALTTQHGHEHGPKRRLLTN